MKRISIVIGTGFGDEGKGRTVSFLCEKKPKNRIVVRFNGGHQVGHTVEYNSYRHVFSNFGSGTLQKTPTYWGKNCTVEILGMLKELEALQEQSLNPILFIDPLCPITTYYDMTKTTQGDYIKNGTCGLGFGSTIQRKEDHYNLNFMDLFFDDILKEKYRKIKEYYSCTSPIYTKYDNMLFRAVDRLRLNKNIFCESVDLNKYEHIIFEGAQGTLLDQDFGFFPNVTRSNTTVKEAFNMIKLLDNSYKITVFYVTRSYLTRHGNGNMPNEGIVEDLNLINNELETNVLNKQGEFRKTLLSLDLLKYSLQCNRLYYKSLGRPIEEVLVMSCMDQLVNKRYVDNGKIYSFEYVSDISSKLGIQYNVEFYTG